MQTLKFYSHLANLILAGSKTTTWRLFDDKDLQVSDRVTFINKDTGEVFGTALITKVWVRKMGALEEVDWVGHERYESLEAMYKNYQSFYGEPVGPDTEVRIHRFEFTPVR